MSDLEDVRAELARKRERLRHVMASEPLPNEAARLRRIEAIRSAREQVRRLEGVLAEVESEESAA